MKSRIALLKYSDLRAVCLSIFVINIGYGMVTPNLSIYANGLGLPVMLVGIMFSIFALTKMICATPAGFLSDLFTDKRMLVIANSIYAVSTFLFTLTDDPYWFVIFRAFEGVAEGLALPAMYSVISRSVQDRERGEAIGTFVTFSSAGSSLGPMIGSIAVSYLGYKSIFYFTSLVALCTTLIVFKGVSNIQSSPTPGISIWSTFRDEFQAMYRGRAARMLYGLALLAFFVDFTYSALQSTGPLYMRQELGSTLSEVGLFFTLNFLVFAFFSPLGGKLADILGARRLAMAASGGVALFLVAASLASSYPMFLILFVGEFFMATLLFPATQVLAASLFPQGKQAGRAYGILNTVRSLGLLVGPLASTAVFQFSSRSLFLVVGIVGMCSLVIFAATQSRARVLESAVQARDAD